MNHRVKRILPTLVDKVKPTTDYPSGVGAGSGSAVITNVEFTDSASNVIKGTLSSYINDDLYNYLFENMNKSSGYQSLTMWNASTDTEKTFDAAMNKMVEIAGDDKFYTVGNKFIDMNAVRNITNYGTKYAEILTTWFGDNIIQTATGSKYRYTKPTLPSGSTFFGQEVIATGTYAFNKMGDYYNRMHPFFSSITYNSSARMTYLFPVYPSSAWTKSGSGAAFNIDGLQHYTLNGESCPFIAWIQIICENVSYPYITKIEAHSYAYKETELLTWLQSTSGNNAGTYDWLTSGSDISFFGDDEVWIEPEYIGVLNDTLTCNIEQQKNGVFDLTLTYPAGGKYATEIYNNRYILADYMYGNEHAKRYEYKKATGYQIFKIYKVDRYIDTLTVYAHHYSYAMDGIIVEPFSITGTPEEAFAALMEHAINNNDYMFVKEWVPDGGEPADISKTYTIDNYRTLRECLYGREGSIIDTYGGRFAYEDNHVWWAYGNNGYVQGNETGFKVEYGSNMTEFDYSVDTDDVYDGVIGYANDETNNHIFNGYYTTQEDISLTKRFLSVDMTDKFSDNFPTYIEGQTWYDEVNKLCQKYYENNNKGTPDVSLQTGYVVDLQNIAGVSKNITEQVALGDTVQVVFKKWGIAVKLEVVKISYNALTGRNESIELNQPKKTLADTIANLITQ